MTQAIDSMVYPSLARSINRFDTSENLDEAAVSVSWIIDEMEFMDHAVTAHLDTLFWLTRSIQDDAHRAKFDEVNDQLTKDYVYMTQTAAHLSDWIAEHGKRQTVTISVECATFERERVIEALSDIGVFVKDWSEHERED